MNKKTCLIVEGGGFKTAFTSGILDAFLVQKKTDFDGYIGISGGAIAVSYFLANQYKLCFEAIQLLASDEHFVKYKRTFGTEGIMDIDYLAQIAKEKVPFNLTNAYLNSKNKKVAFVATNRRYGNAEYFEPDESSWIDMVIASSTLPFVTKGKHKINGKSYFDGGWSDPLPIIWAYNQGFNDITVLRTNPKEMKTKQSWSDYFGSIYFSKRPELSECFTNCYDKYNEAVDFMMSPPLGLTVKQIAPKENLLTSTMSFNEKTLVQDYRHGLSLGIDFVTDYNQ